MSEAENWLDNGYLKIENFEALEKFIPQDEFLNCIEKFLITKKYPLDDSKYITIKIIEDEIEDEIPNTDPHLNTVGITTSLAVINSFTKVRIKIFIFKLEHKIALINVLFHELDHALWLFQYGEWSNSSNIEHNKRPHEKRAISIAKQWQKKNYPDETKIFDARLRLLKKAEKMQIKTSKSFEKLKNINTNLPKFIKKILIIPIELRYKRKSFKFFKYIKEAKELLSQI